MAGKERFVERRLQIVGLDRERIGDEWFLERETKMRKKKEWMFLYKKKTDEHEPSEFRRTQINAVHEIIVAVPFSRVSKIFRRPIRFRRNFVGIFGKRQI